MAGDTICRMGSMSKPIVAACAMRLVEDCTLRLDDPVDGLLLGAGGHEGARRSQRATGRHRCGEPGALTRPRRHTLTRPRRHALILAGHRSPPACETAAYGSVAWR